MSESVLKMIGEPCLKELQNYMPDFMDDPRYMKRLINYRHKDGVPLIENSLYSRVCLMICARNYSRALVLNTNMPVNNYEAERQSESLKNLEREISRMIEKSKSGPVYVWVVSADVFVGESEKWSPHVKALWKCLEKLDDKYNIKKFYYCSSIVALAGDKIYLRDDDSIFETPVDKLDKVFIVGKKKD